MFSRRKKDKKDVWEDDGRSFADMNVEGMPWYRPPQPTDRPEGQKNDMSPENYRSFMWGAVKAALLIAAVFAGGYFLFIVFLDKIVFGN